MDAKAEAEQAQKKAELDSARAVSKAKLDAAAVTTAAEQQAELEKSTADLKVAEAKLKVDNMNKLQAVHQKTLDVAQRQTKLAKQALDGITGSQVVQPAPVAATPAPEAATTTPEV